MITSQRFFVHFMKKKGIYDKTGFYCDGKLEVKPCFIVEWYTTA